MPPFNLSHIGKICPIGPNVVMRTSFHNFNNKEMYIQDQGHTSADIIIEDNCWIAANVTILGVPASCLGFFLEFFILFCLSFGIFFEIFITEKAGGMDIEAYNNSTNEYNLIFSEVNWETYYINNPFEKSSRALYDWAPVADELKKLDKQIVLNSMILKWNNIQKDFKKLASNFESN